MDSIDRPVSPQLGDTHKRSKSILKKTDSGGGGHHHHHHHHRNDRNGRNIGGYEDPESERLISDNISASGVSDNGCGGMDAGSGSGSDYSPAKYPLLAKSVSPPIQRRHRSLGSY